MKLKLLTYNLAMLPTPLGKAKKKRAEKFADQILSREPKYDIICLQEIFDEHIRKDLINCLEVEYPYMIKKSGDHDFLNQDSGLFFASKFPILRHTYREYTSRSILSSDALADKGILTACFEFGEGNESKILHVVVTHLQSTEIRPPVAFYDVRQKQLAQLRKFIESSLETEGVTCDPFRIYSILLGDFNVIGETDEYESMTKRLDYPRDLYMEKNPGQDGFTWNSKNNLYIHYAAEQDRDLQRLDYVFTFDHIPYADEKREKMRIGKIVCESCNLYTPRASNVIEEDMNTEFDLSDHYGLEAVIVLG